MVRITGEIGEPPARLLDLWRLDELRGITSDGGAITLGALTTYTEIRRSAPCREHLPALVEAAATIGAAQIQNRGTLGGNIANASPAGDTLPVLLALDARSSSAGHGASGPSLRTSSGSPTAAPPRPRRADPPDPDPGRRRPRGALSQDRDAAGPGDQQGRDGRRLARGPGQRGVARRPRRSRLDRRPADPGRGRRGGARGPGRRRPKPADRAAEALAGEIHPIDDVRSTAEYRRVVAARALHRIVRDAGGW